MIVGSWDPSPRGDDELEDGGACFSDAKAQLQLSDANDVVRIHFHSPSQ
jgi:hypothetical protein